jgi:hypothetical protein
VEEGAGTVLVVSGGTDEIVVSGGTEVLVVASETVDSGEVVVPVAPA